MKRTFYFITAIATHKFVIIFCVGLELFNAATPGKEYVMYMLMYSFMSPVGIGIGTVIDIAVEHHHGSSYHATVGILQVNCILYFRIAKNISASNTIPMTLLFFAS